MTLDRLTVLGVAVSLKLDKIYISYIIIPVLIFNKRGNKMKTCTKCEHKVENDDNVCSNCGTRLRERCQKCGLMEPMRFINAEICQKKAKETKEEFISKNYSYISTVIMFVSVILMLGSLFITSSFYPYTITLFLIGLIFEKKEDKRVELSFIKNNPEIGVLLIE
jgi:hypothetical protein